MSGSRDKSSGQKSEGNKKPSRRRKKKSDSLEIRVSGRLRDHLYITSLVTGHTKADLLRMGFDDLFRKYRRDYEIPRNVSYEDFKKGFNQDYYTEE